MMNIDGLDYFRERGERLIKLMDCREFLCRWQEQLDEEVVNEFRCDARCVAGPAAGPGLEPAHAARRGPAIQWVPPAPALLSSRERLRK
jgi:hypothetical protein